MMMCDWRRPLAARRKKINAGASCAALSALAIAAGLIAAPLSASAQPAEREQAGSITAPQDLGRIVSGQEQSISVYLNLHDQAGFDQAVDALYDPASPSYHHWFTDADFARYAPTAAELHTVQAELERQGLKVVSVDPLNFSLRVRGSASAIESTFHTELHNVSYGRSVVQTPTSAPKLAGAAGNLVAGTVGIERHQAQPLYAIAKNPQTGKPLAAASPISSTQTLSAIMNHLAVKTTLTAPSTTVLKGRFTAFPVATYFGPRYADSVIQVVANTPSQVQGFYGMTPLINQGYDGRGQTIALVEAFGYANAMADANLAASTFGLPALTKSTFQVVYPSGPPGNPNDADLVGWTTEIALDIQSAHTVAPGAKIVEVAAAGQDDEDLIAALQYILTNHTATIVSCSWEVDPEFLAGAAEEQAFAPVLQRMAAAGISVQFSSGDSGDYGMGTPKGVVGVPSNSPYVTAVGGTSVLNDPLGSGDIVTGWGTNIALLGTIVEPTSAPALFGGGGGAGGGESLYYAKPAWQSSLPGTGRQVPDVSALADPFTGVPIVVTSFGVQEAVLGIGGTSLAAPLFSGIWAVAQQYNNTTLGQAAPIVARLKPGQITDVIATSDLTPDSLSGTITTAAGTTSYTPSSLFTSAGAAIAQPNFLVALSPLATGIGNSFAISFGADTSLTVGPGWDNVTGYGQPNGLPFIQGVGAKP